mgnify:CR=1 FL=1
MRTTKKGKFFLYLILTLGALLILFPMYITITTTFKTPAESAVSFFTLPNSLYLGNYATVLQDEKLYYAYGNTILITVVSLLGEMLILPPMGFALSRGMKQNRFFKGLYFFFLLGIFLPWQVRMMPVVKLMGWLGLLSPLGITLLYVAHATCESMFLYVGYLATVSDSIEEAAYIDGANELQILWKVIVPLCKPALATFTLFHAVGHWNGYFNATMYINSRDKWPLMLIVREMVAESGTSMVHQSATAIEDLAQPFTLQMAIIIFTIIPILCVYPFVQKYFMKGMLMGSVKG